MQGTRNATIKSLQTMQNTIKEKSSPTTATRSGQDIQAHVAQSDGDITAPIRPRGEANLGPTKAVQPPSQSIRRPRTPPPGPARHRMVPAAARSSNHGRASPPAPSNSVRAVGRGGSTTQWVGATRRRGARGAGPLYPGPELWYHSQADPTRAAETTGHPVVSSKTPEVSAKTHTHNWCGRQRQAANTTQRCEAQLLLASLGGFGTALLSRSDILTCPLPSTLRGTLASGP